MSDGVVRFVCKFCGSSYQSVITGAYEGIVYPCTCPEAEQDREHQHRMEIERRKVARRGVYGIKKRK